jgi:hypothetical protein
MVGNGRTGFKSHSVGTCGLHTNMGQRKKGETDRREKSLVKLSTKIEIHLGPYISEDLSL